MASKRYLVWICSILILASSCEKYNGIDNTGVIRTPYVLMVGGLDGTIRKSNDINYFPRLNGNDGPDNTPIRQIITADSNILFLKGNCYVSDDNGRAFNLTNANALPYYDAFYKYYLPQQMIYDASQRKVYLCVNGGLQESSDLGKTFAPSPLGASPTSIVELDNGDLYAIQDDANIFTRPGGVGPWFQVTPGSSTLTAGNNYYLTSFGNILVATDFEGTAGCSFSINGGADWTNFGGVSGNGRYILSVESVERPGGGYDLFMCRDSMGVFKLDQATSSFEASSTGIPWYARNHDIEVKKIVYRNGLTRYFYFCATDVGLFLSEEDSGGQDWRQLLPGEFSTLQ